MEDIYQVAWIDRDFSGHLTIFGEANKSVPKTAIWITPSL
jgi:hypothetical protein